MENGAVIVIEDNGARGFEQPNGLVREADTAWTVNGRPEHPRGQPGAQPVGLAGRINPAHVGRYKSGHEGWKIPGWDGVCKRVLTIVGTFQVGCGIIGAIPADLVRSRGFFGNKTENKQDFYQKLVGNRGHNRERFYEILVRDDNGNPTVLPVLTPGTQLIDLSRRVLPGSSWIRLTPTGVNWFQQNWEILYRYWIHPNLQSELRSIANNPLYEMTPNILDLATPPANNMELKNKLCTYYCPHKKTQETLVYLFDNPGWQNKRDVIASWSEQISAPGATVSLAQTSMVVETRTHNNQNTYLRIRPHIWLFPPPGANIPFEQHLQIGNANGDQPEPAPDNEEPPDSSDDEIVYAQPNAPAQAVPGAQADAAVQNQP